jgi:hypothetical protein
MEKLSLGKKRAVYETFAVKKRTISNRRGRVHSVRIGGIRIGAYCSDLFFSKLCWRECYDAIEDDSPSVCSRTILGGTIQFTVLYERSTCGS